MPPLNFYVTVACSFVQLRIAKVKQTTTNGIDSTYGELDSGYDNSGGDGGDRGED